jgi:hypothetical protein
MGNGTTKQINVHGVFMASIEEMAFAKYISKNSIAMNTRTQKERFDIASAFVENLRKAETAKA